MILQSGLFHFERQTTDDDDDALVIYGKYDPHDGFFWCMLAGGAFGIIMNAFIYFVLFSTSNLTNHLRVLKNLAFTDMLQNLGMIAQICYPAKAGIPDGIGGQIICRIYLSNFLVLTLTCASSWLVVFLTMELLGASKGDLKPKWYTFLFGTKCRIRCLLVFSWVLGLVILNDSPFNFYIRKRDGEVQCVLGCTDFKFLKYIGLVLQISLVMIIPLIIVFVCYFKLFRETAMAKRHHEGRRDFDPQSEFLYQCAKSFMRSLCIRLTLIVTFYILAWVPNQIFWYVYVIGNANIKLEEKLMQHWFDQLVQLTPLVNCALNPFLYAWTWFEFRGIVVPKLKRICPCLWKKRPATAQNVLYNQRNQNEYNNQISYAPNNRDSNYEGTRTSTLPSFDDISD